MLFNLNGQIIHVPPSEAQCLLSRQRPLLVHEIKDNNTMPAHKPKNEKLANKDTFSMPNKHVAIAVPIATAV